ncbi:MAG: hypothetical protein Solivirus5_11 [Solivirus sp.]|uniref:Uncharacterized protein n=1 Tax=Solivirus sp. TaxID=2487772 RepID=A0A3G5AJJ0_9VIRU|nr:MAG: hypothetical protein Solivirus5_11 [Solivirus sp.]
MLKRIYDRLFEARKSLSKTQETQQKKRVSIQEPDHILLQSINSEYVLKSNRIKEIVGRLIKSDQLRDRVDLHEKECFELIDIFDLGREKRELLLNLTVILRGLFIYQEYEILTVGSFLFGAFYKFECNHKELYICLSLSGLERESKIFGNFFYFESEKEYISSTDKLNELLSSTTYVFIKEPEIKFLPIVSKNNVTKIQLEGMYESAEEGTLVHSEKGADESVVIIDSSTSKEVVAVESPDDSVVILKRAEEILTDNQAYLILVGIALIILFILLILWYM